MHILHIALQGCLRLSNVRYGITPDTGGHITYLLDLAAALSRSGAVEQTIATRAFDRPDLGSCHLEETETGVAGLRLVRLAGDVADYLPKEELWREHATLARHLGDRIESGELRPDVIHAHYCDAGALALEMKRRFGIPFVFTAHSLGRVKAEVVRSPATDLELSRRIAIEERVISDADLVIASSEDEHTKQYGLYASKPARSVVIPPGCDLARFSSATLSPEIAAQFDRFLRDPMLPPVVAVARPVARKNLDGLIEAFARAGLAKRANLVIFAGCRDDLREDGTETRAVIRDLLEMIDRADLWGSVALPKQHEPDDVPGILDWACRLHGLFANIAHNEPFGLTMLEAAASGLPVVATTSGGPSEIVPEIGHGLLASPADPGEVGAAMSRILSDRSLWDRFSSSGLANVGHYDWDAHARRYLCEVRKLERASPTAAPAFRRDRAADRLLIVDIDETLTGDARAIIDLRRWLADHRNWAFGVATGRNLDDAMRILGEWGVAPPRVAVTSVGSQVHVLDAGAYRAIPSGTLRFDGVAVERVLAGFPSLELQRVDGRGPRKRSFDGDPSLVESISCFLNASGLPANVIGSHGRFIDVLPADTDKASGARRAAAALGVPWQGIVAAGDSGNDEALLSDAPAGIVVANHRDGLARRLARRKSVIRADRKHAAGILEVLLSLVPE